MQKWTRNTKKWVNHQKMCQKTKKMSTQSAKKCEMDPPMLTLSIQIRKHPHNTFNKATRTDRISQKDRRERLPGERQFPAAVSLTGGGQGYLPVT